MPQLVEHQHVNPEITGSVPAPVNVSLFTLNNTLLSKMLTHAYKALCS